MVAVSSTTLLPILWRFSQKACVSQGIRFRTGNHAGLYCYSFLNKLIFHRMQDPRVGLAFLMTFTFEMVQHTMVMCCKG